MAGELPEDALEDIMIAEAMDNERQNRNMPGAMPEQDLIFAEFTDEEDETDGNADAPADGHAPTQAQNIRNPQDIPVDPDMSSDEEEDDSEVEDVAVSLALHRASPALLICRSNASPCQYA